MPLVTNIVAAARAVIFVFEGYEERMQLLATLISAHEKVLHQKYYHSIVCVS